MPTPRATRRYLLLRTKVKRVYAGGMRQPDLAGIRERGLTRHADVLGYVPYRDSLSLLRSAHVPCLVAGPQRGLRIPGKLYDCLAARRPTLAAVLEEATA